MTASPTSGSPASTCSSETGAELPQIRSLGYGRCRLAAAVPNDTPYQAVEDLAGLRVATAHPNTARRFFEGRGIPVEIIPISGAVEVAPRLGLAEGIVDLVSTGSTLVMNGLRQIGDVLDVRGDPRRQPGRATASEPRTSPPSTRCSAPSSPRAVAST